MPFLIENAPAYMHPKFERSMASLASSPRHDPSNAEYQYFGPFPKKFLLEWPSAESDILSAPHGGWQYLIHDSQGFAVMDLSNAETGSFSRVRRGRFACAYHDALVAMERALEGTTEEAVVEFLEVPASFTATMVLKRSDIELFPVSVKGRTPSSKLMSPEDFAALGSGTDYSAPTP